MDKRWIDYLKEPKQKMPEYVFLFADGSFRWKELVRCKDCKFMDDAECCTRYADEGAIHSTQLYGHCWLGERREDE